MSLHEYAEREMAIAWPESDDMQDEIKKDILQIIDVFSEQGHSGMSGAYLLNVLDKLIRFKPITPLTGDAKEWGKPSGDDFCQQNKRCSSVFRRNFDNSTAYDIDGKVFSDDGGETFYSCRESRIPVVFPYMPKERPEHIVRETKEVCVDVEEDQSKYYDLSKKYMKIDGCIVKYNRPWKDGTIIRDGAFKNEDGAYIPITSHFDFGESDDNKIIGYAKLEYRDHDGVYYKGVISDPDMGWHAVKELYENKNDWKIGCFINKLEFNDAFRDVKDGRIVYGALSERCDDAAYIENIEFEPKDEGMWPNG